MTSPNHTSLNVPGLTITAQNGTCLDTLCTSPWYHEPWIEGSCQGAPRFVVGFTDSVVKSGKCKRDEFNLTVRSIFTEFYDLDKYPTICTFDSFECAQAVCSLQGISPNETSGWPCYSDPVIAQAAADGTYWFANGSMCSSKPKCKDVRDTRNVNYSSAPRLGVALSLALALAGASLAAA